MMAKNVIAYIACFWLFVVLNSFFIWNSYENIIRVVAGLGMLIATLYISKKSKIYFSKRACWILLAIIFYFVYLTSRMDKSIPALIVRASSFIPLMFIIFWSGEYLSNMYNIFRKLIIFFACGSTFITLFSLSGLIAFLPYFVVNAQSSLHEMHGVVYHIYGCFVTIHEVYSSIIPRACGMLQEPGHFAIILGFVFLIDRILNQKINFWIVVCGLLTFSSNFIIIACLGEIYNMKYNNKAAKSFKIYIITLLLSIVLFFILNENLQEQIIYLLYDRNLKNVFDSLTTTGSLSSALDERINQTGAFYFEQFMRSQDIWFGKDIADDSIILSDYRGMILRIGILGLMLSSLLAYVTSLGSPWKIRIPIILVLGLVFLHRAWMMYAPYLYLMSIMTVALYKYNLHLGFKKENS